jgi:hypothetical protein
VTLTFLNAQEWLFVFDPLPIKSESVSLPRHLHVDYQSRGISDFVGTAVRDAQKATFGCLKEEDLGNAQDRSANLPLKLVLD